jgi:hypothetical protein
MEGQLETALAVTMARTPARLRADEAAVLSLLRRRARRKVRGRDARLYQYAAGQDTHAA